MTKHNHVLQYLYDRGIVFVIYGTVFVQIRQLVYRKDILGVDCPVTEIIVIKYPAVSEQHEKKQAYCSEDRKNDESGQLSFICVCMQSPRFE